MANSRLMEELKKKYGSKEGTRIYLTIVPGILADFRKMLKKAEPEEEITETYRFEDGDGAVEVKGSRSADGETRIEAHLTSIS